jgi:hypothetical protein
LRPRPRRRSGWQTTLTTSWRPSINRSSVGTAKSGVPKKARRSGELVGAVAKPLTLTSRLLFEFAAQLLLSALGVEVALEAADPIDEEDAVEVIDLVLKTHRL